MERKNKRIKQTSKFLNWIKRYSGWWFLICTPNDEHMNPQMMKLLVERLAKESFYEIIFVLLMVHRNEEFMDQIFKSMLLEMLSSHWRDDNNEIIKRLIEYLE